MPRAVLDAVTTRIEPGAIPAPGVDAGEESRAPRREVSADGSYRIGKPHFIDKMPNNFRHVGLIHLMLPNAKIIDARREPMACCFGNLKQLYARGQEFVYSVEDIARYYRTYLELMEHWDAVLPGRVLRVHHEDVVDVRGQRAADPTTANCRRRRLEFYRTERSIRTASGAGAPLFMRRATGRTTSPGWVTQSAG